MTEKELKFAIKVIKQARKLGVIKLKLGTLEFELQNQNEQPRVHRPTFKVSAKKIAELDEKNQLQMELNSAEDDLSTMHIEDPSGFEQAMVEKELEDGTELEETQNI